MLFTASLILPAAASGSLNNCPVALPSSVSVAMDSMVSDNLMASDADAEPLTFFVTQPPAHGAIVVQASTGAFTYSPSSGYCGPDSIKFKVNDGECDSSEATLSISVVCGTQTPTPTPTSTVTPTDTPTTTPTPTPVPQGGSCTDTFQCLTGLFCVDTFCCDRPCNSLFDRCDISGREGTCLDTPAAAPATSPTGLIGIAAVLFAIGVAGVLRNQRKHWR